MFNFLHIDFVQFRFMDSEFQLTNNSSGFNFGWVVAVTAPYSKTRMGTISKS